MTNVCQTSPPLHFRHQFLLTSQSQEQKRGQVGKHAIEQEVAATIHYYSKKFNLKESSMRIWRHLRDSHTYHRLEGELARLVSRRRDQVDVVSVVDRVKLYHQKLNP